MTTPKDQKAIAIQMAEEESYQKAKKLSLKQQYESRRKARLENFHQLLKNLK